MQRPQRKMGLLHFANVDLGHSGVLLQSNVMIEFSLWLHNSSWLILLVKPVLLV